MTLSILVGSEPDVLIAQGLVLPIDQVSNDANVITHVLQRMDTGWVGVDSTLVSSCDAHVVPVLIVQLYAVQADIEEVSMRGVEVDFEKEANWHRDWLTLLEVVHLGCLGVKTALHRNDFFVRPALHVGDLDRLTDVVHSVDGAWSNSQCDALLWCHEFVVEADDDLSGAAKGVLG